MNRGHARLLFCVSFAVLVGCGARTESFSDESEGGGPSASGATSFGGGIGVGGNGLPGVGGKPPSSLGGAPTFGGGPATAGAAGTPPPFGGFSNGGTGAFGAFGATGGVTTAGAPATGGFGAFGSFGGASVAGAGGFGEAGAGATGGIIEACLVVSDNACDQCVCKTCASQVGACFSDLGCALIFACIQQTGCQGIQCYAPGACKPIIDQFGGLAGGSVNKVFGLVTCSVTSQNQCGCN